MPLETLKKSPLGGSAFVRGEKPQEESVPLRRLGSPEEVSPDHDFSKVESVPATPSMTCIAIIIR